MKIEAHENTLTFAPETEDDAAAIDALGPWSDEKDDHAPAPGAQECIGVMNGMSVYRRPDGALIVDPRHAWWNYDD